MLACLWQAVLDLLDEPAVIKGREQEVHSIHQKFHGQRVSCAAVPQACMLHLNQIDPCSILSSLQ